MYLPLTATALCEARSHQSTHVSGDSGVRRILAPFLELLPTSTSGGVRLLPAACSDPDMAPTSHDHDHGGGSGHVLPDEIQEGTLLFFLSNPLLLSLTVDHLPPSATVSLAATSRAFRNLIHHTPGVFRRLDLTQVKSAQFDIDPIDQGGEVWRNVQLDENLTEDDFYSGPLRGIFGALRRQQILRDVSTLILDGLSVTAELVHEIISDPSYSVRILSLREVKNLNEPKLRAALQMAVRPSRPEGTPRLKGLYIFGAKDPPCLTGDTAAIGNGGNATAAGWNQRSHQALSDVLHQPSDLWYDRKGTVVPRPVPTEWASTILACAGLISFDAVLCRGPRHFNSPAFGQVSIGPSSPPSPQVPSSWAVATHALDGCAGCGAAPEGWTVWGESAGTDGDDDTCRFPLLAPPPVHSSNTKVACCPSGADVKPSRSGGSNRTEQRRFLARCMECLRDRYCWGCNKWWCEKCYVPGQMDSHVDGLYYKARMARSCWECGNNCSTCIDQTQRQCRCCRGGYCIIHNEGSTSEKCDCESWSVPPGVSCPIVDFCSQRVLIPPSFASLNSESEESGLVCGHRRQSYSPGGSTDLPVYVVGPVAHT
ncbi:hypothetical protein FJTKL_13586 [Diaporthe vaccinii]|uniref:F-box domain-containing protein n=1 Tax=Diaporthe vaccinii TaxID=105482 RepID=A0ABR4E9Z2_9PEZI